jgi:hypothetical protein
MYANLPLRCFTGGIILSRTPCSTLWVASVLVFSWICSTANANAEQQNAKYFRDVHARNLTIAAGCTNRNYPIDCGNRMQRWHGFDSGLHGR